MKRLLLVLPLLVLIGCQTSLILSPYSGKGEFKRATAGCRAGDNVITLRSGAVVNATRVEFRPDSVLWAASDTVRSGAPLDAVRRVENCDYARGAAEGTRIGVAAGLMAGGFLVSMAMGRSDQSQSTPWILLATTTLIIGPISGHAEGVERGSRMTIIVDSTANKK